MMEIGLYYRPHESWSFRLSTTFETTLGTVLVYLSQTPRASTVSLISQSLISFRASRRIPTGGPGYCPLPMTSRPLRYSSKPLSRTTRRKGFLPMGFGKRSLVILLSRRLGSDIYESDSGIEAAARKIRGHIYHLIKISPKAVPVSRLGEGIDCS